jgi:hypothetical protein
MVCSPVVSAPSTGFSLASGAISPPPALSPSRSRERPDVGVLPKRDFRISRRGDQ